MLRIIFKPIDILLRILLAVFMFFFKAVFFTIGFFLSKAWESTKLGAQVAVEGLDAFKDGEAEKRNDC